MPSVTAVSAATIHAAKRTAPHQSTLAPSRRSERGTIHHARARPGTRPATGTHSSHRHPSRSMIGPAMHQATAPPSPSMDDISPTAEALLAAGTASLMIV